MSEADAKVMLQDKIDSYVQERITFADDVIVEYAMSKIADGDVILTYAVRFNCSISCRSCNELNKNNKCRGIVFVS